MSASATSGRAFALEVAALSDAGTERPRNEDAVGHEAFGEASVLVAVADGISGGAGAEEASRMAIDSTLRTYREQPRHTRLARRLHRAAQQANIDVYDRASVVTELRGMGTTLTALAIERGELAAVHVGDSRLYLVREGRLTQLTRDHTVTGDRVRLGLMSEARARQHPERSTLTRCLGRQLIVGFDRFTRRLLHRDALLVCSDGLYNALDESAIARIVGRQDAQAACRELVAAANQRGTMDNLTVAVVRMIGPAPPDEVSPVGGGGGFLANLLALGRGRPRGS